MCFKGSSHCFDLCCESISIRRPTHVGIITENHIVILISSQKLRSHGMHVNFATTIFRHKGAPLFCYHTTRHKRVSPPILPHLPGHKKERPSILLHIPLDTRGEASHFPNTIRYKKGPPILLRPRLKQKGDSTIYTRRFPLFRYVSLLTQAEAAPPMSAHPSSDIRVSPHQSCYSPLDARQGSTSSLHPPFDTSGKRGLLYLISPFC